MVKEERKLKYISSSKKDLEKLPLAVKEMFIHGLELALLGEKHPDAEPLKGFGDASVLEIRERHKRDAYRAIDLLHNLSFVPACVPVPVPESQVRPTHIGYK